MSHRDEPHRVDSICHDKAFHPFGCNRVRLGSKERAMQLLLDLLGWFGKKISMFVGTRFPESKAPISSGFARS